MAVSQYTFIVVGPIIPIRHLLAPPTSNVLVMDTHGIAVQKHDQDNDYGLCNPSWGNKVCNAGSMPATTGALLHRLDSLLREQDGFVTTHQAELLGVRRSKLHALVRGGDLRSVIRSVYVLTRAAPAPRVDERTYAVWLALDGQRLPWDRKEPIVVLSHTSAARLHGLGTLPDGVIEMTSVTRRTTTLPAIRLHVAPLEAIDWQWAMERRIMVTTPARTIADLALSPIERDYVLDALDDAIEQRTATSEAVLAATARRSPRRVATITRLLTNG